MYAHYEGDLSIMVCGNCFCIYGHLYLLIWFVLPSRYCLLLCVSGLGRSVLYVHYPLAYDTSHCFHWLLRSHWSLHWKRLRQGGSFIINNYVISSLIGVWTSPVYIYCHFFSFLLHWWWLLAETCPFLSTINNKKIDPWLLVFCLFHPCHNRAPGTLFKTWSCARCYFLLYHH